MTELVPVKKQEVALNGFGRREEIGAMRERIVAMMPGASKLSKEEQFGLAQIAVAHNLNPFNGEVWAIAGKGLMIGIELDKTCTDLTSRALDQGLLINVTADRTIRLLPPLILSDDEAQHLIDGVVRLVNDFTAH